MQAVYFIPVNNTLLEVQSPFLGGPKAVLIENHAGDNIAFDNGSDPAYLIPPGVSVPMNLSHLTYTLRFRSATNTTGSAKVTVYDNEIDTSRAPALQQLPGGVSITGSVSIPSTVTIAGSVSSSDATAQSLLTDLKTLINTLNTQVGITNTLDTDIRTYSNYVRGLLALSGQSFTVASGAEFVYTLTAPLAGFTLQTAPGNTGRLNIYVINGVGGAKDYLLKDQILYTGPSTLNPSPKIYRRNLLTGDALHIGWDDSTASCGFALRV